MMKEKIGLLIIILMTTISLGASTVTVDFYSERITVNYDTELIAAYSNSIAKEDGIVAFYKELEKRPYQSLITSLKKAKLKYQLNDWLYYQLLEKSLDKICQSRSDRFQGVVSWLLVTKSGYNTRATFTKSNFYVNVATREAVFESPMFEVDGKSFANLSAIMRQGRMIKMVYGVQYAPNRQGKNFSFSLDKHPKLKPVEQRFTYLFDYKDKSVKMLATVDKTIVDVMRDYPKFDEIYFVKAPFSQSIKKSLLPALKKAMKGMREQEQMEFLVAFTRGGLRYGSDRKGFGKTNRPLTAEEALFYPTVDCEDKVAVIYNLVKELTVLKAVVLAMPEHLSFAVDLKQPVGKTIKHRGKKYTICDPTGPENTNEIGVFPYDAELRRGEILGEL